jgi:hypothetical protein
MGCDWSERIADVEVKLSFFLIGSDKKSSRGEKIFPPFRLELLHGLMFRELRELAKSWL